MRRWAFLFLNVIGLAGFLWPLLLAAGGGPHSLDAPVLVALLVPLCVFVAVGDSTDTRELTLLAALVAVNAFMRIPKGPSGEGFVFVLPIIAGWLLGPRFGFNLGAFSILVSAVLTGGVGPWLPFQMFGTGWVGAGAGIAGRAFGSNITRPAARFAAAGYSAVAAIVYGALMTLWFWPFATVAGPAGFAPDSGVGATAASFFRYWLLTSASWDVGRAVFSNIPGVLLLAGPVGVVVSRARERLRVADGEAVRFET